MSSSARRRWGQRFMQTPLPTWRRRLRAYRNKAQLEDDKQSREDAIGSKGVEFENMRSSKPSTSVRGNELATATLEGRACQRLDKSKRHRQRS